MSERLNVLFVPSWYPSDELPMNGIFVREHARAVRLKDNVAVLYLATQAGSYHDYDDEGIRTIKHAVHFGGMGLGLIRYLRQGLHDFAHLRRSFKPDIIHAHVVYPAGLLGLAISLRYHLPLVLTEHSNPFSMQMGSRLKRFLVRQVTGRSKVICPVSHDLQQQMQHYGINGLYNIVPNAINMELFSYSPSPPHTDDCKRILLVAMLAEYKGIPYLLRALAELRAHRQDFSLDVAGDGPLRAEYETLTAELGLSDNVRFLGMKTKPEVAALLHDCDFLVVSSLNETMGVTLIEALASGKPVVSTRCGGPEEVVNEQVGVLVDKASAEALRDGLDWMLDHYRDYDPFTLAAHAQECYSYPAVAAQYDAVYRQVKSKPTGAANARPA